MSEKCHIIIKFKIKSPIMAGIPKVEHPIIVYWLIGNKTPVNFWVRRIKKIINKPLKALKNKNLSGFLLLIESIKI